MTQPLSISGFRWLQRNVIDALHDDDDETGYTHFHELHSDSPLAYRHGQHALTLRLQNEAVE